MKFSFSLKFNELPGKQHRKEKESIFSTPFQTNIHKQAMAYENAHDFNGFKITKNLI